MSCTTHLYCNTVHTCNTVHMQYRTYHTADEKKKKKFSRHLSTSYELWMRKITNWTPLSAHLSFALQVMFSSFAAGYVFELLWLSWCGLLFGVSTVTCSLWTWIIWTVLLTVVLLRRAARLAGACCTAGQDSMAHAWWTLFSTWLCAYPSVA